MPLEQIGAPLQLLHSSTGASASSVYDSGHRGKGTDHSDTYGDEEAAWITPNTPNTGLDESHEGGSYMSNFRSTQLGGSSKSKRAPAASEDMTLLKLGGVGGVQRSGSARYGRQPAVRTNICGTASAMPNDDEEETESESECISAEEGKTPPSTSTSAYNSATTPTACTSLRQIGRASANVQSKDIPSSPIRETPPRSPSVTQSPRRRGRTLVDGEPVGRIPPSPLLTGVLMTNEVRSKFDSLSLSAAAQAQQVPPIEHSARSSFVPQEPRRHTGSFALRSRSALAQTLGSDSLTFGNGLGRAASRRIAKTQDEAAAQSKTDPDTPRAKAVNIAEGQQPTEPEPVEQQTKLQLPVSSSTDEVGAGRRRHLTGNRSVGVSPRSRIIDLVMSPALPMRTTEPDETQSAAAGQEYFGNDSKNVQKSAMARSPIFTPTSPFESELSAFSQEPLPVPRGSLGVYEDGSTDSAQQQQGYLSAPSVRPGIVSRTSSSALSTGGGSGAVNVLRTPTTEEWSRYLMNQGLDPTQLSSVVAGVGREGTRSRSNTSRSVQRARGRLSERDWGVMSALPTTTLAGQSETLSKGDEEAGTAFRAHSRTSSAPRQTDSFDLIGDNDGTQEYLEGAEPDRDLTQTPLDRDVIAHENYQSGSDEYSSDELDEHIRVLNEIISRPPSRLGTPAPSESGHERMSGSVEAIKNAESLRGRWPQRETAAVLSDYPLPPLGEQRSISDFVVVDDIGRGAYGLVKKVKLKDERTGEGVGSEFCIKYIIKSRILADCWRRHKILGPIPVEIHVLDQLRRLSYVFPSRPAPWSAEELFGLPPLLHVAAKDDGDQLIAVGHPSLCMMVDFFEDHEFYYLVMPCFGRGQDLFDYVESQPQGLNSKQVRCIFGQLADGLSFLHDNNIVHRDVKDENVILDGKGHIQLIDFGSAAHINTRNGGRLFDTFSGTLDYAAAEILRGEKYGGKEQDVWALGVVGYVLLCGDCPFWNGEEAMHGLRHDTRAYNVLSERCSKKEDGVSADKTAVGSTDSSSKDGQTHDAFTGQLTNTEALRRALDLRGQTDGGGRLDDAADLIMQCLQLDCTARPTMRQVCQHRFLTGAKGWIGTCGWLDAEHEHEQQQQQQHGQHAQTQDGE